MLHFPEARVVCFPYQAVRTLEEGPTLVVWDSTLGDWPPKRLATPLAERFGLAWPEGRVTHVEARQRAFKSSTRRLGYFLLPAGGGA